MPKASATAGASRKNLGQFFTPADVAQTLVQWGVRRSTDRLLDPSCGDGGFLASHARSVGIELDEEFAKAACQRAPGALVHGGDFFQWAAATPERFEVVAGNPPFIRYQNFTGATRKVALESASRLGAKFSALTSSWAPFLVVAASLLRPGGRLSFVVPAEIGHATYAPPLLRALCRNFRRVQLLAFREKLFPQLSEDCWLLYCDGFGQASDGIHLNAFERFRPSARPPTSDRFVSLTEWEEIGERLRPFLLPAAGLELYRELTKSRSVRRFGDLASASIGYVTGANDFFHLRRSEAKRWGITWHYLKVSIRKSDQLCGDTVDFRAVEKWMARDEPVLLLDLKQARNLPSSVRDYLATEAAQTASSSYKCRNRDPWYAVPDVTVPDAFLSVMSGKRPLLAANDAGCVCTNSLHAVRYRSKESQAALDFGWASPLAQLGAEIQGHPLGGGVLKLEPREVARVPIPITKLPVNRAEESVLQECLEAARSWRHCA
ncbi:MAG: N-6 DNA methylase [Chthoniobacterales bacterium]|nr:N-6 DNA methylase [Chthoniobacterales bacterium]